MSSCVINQKGAVLNMDVWIQSSNINLLDALCDQVKQPISSALIYFANGINEAVVYLEAVGEQGENLSLVCRIDLELKLSGTLTAQAIDESVGAAISRAVHRWSTAAKPLRIYNGQTKYSLSFFRDT